MPVALATHEFADHPAPFVSKQYVHINTNEFIRAMAQEGFQVAEILRDCPRSRDPRFVRHMVKFEHETFKSKPILEEVRPQILFTNSHNRRTRARVQLGVFRFICTNGMVVGDSLAPTIAAPHIGDAAKQLIARAADLARNTSPLFDQINRWSKRQLTPSQINDFAQQAAILRFGEERAKGYDPKLILATRRAEDEGASLWRVFNRAQEALIKGGVEGRTATGRTQASRPLTELNYSTKFNQDLWELATAFE